MKKFLCIALAVVLTLGVIAAFTACSKKDDTTTAAAGADTTAAQQTEKKETLVMATNAEFPPYEYKEGENIVGIDPEIAQAIADKLGMDLKIENVNFDSIIPGVQAGKYDMGMAGMTVNEDRIKVVNFSTPYAKGVQVVIVKEGSDIKSLDDVKGKKIGVQTSTTGDIYATGDYGEEFITRYDNGAVAVQALIAGKVDCVIIDNEPAKSYVAANQGLKILETEYVEEQYAICFNKSNTDLQEKVNKALEELISDGTVQKIVDKYIKAD